MGRGEQQCACPRCGYDLQGQVAAWHPALAEGEMREAAKCPLTGTCSECGLAFQWRAIFRPDLYGPVWFIETRRYGWPRSFVGTAARALHVAAFFHASKSVSLETPVNRRAMWSYAAAVVVGLPCLSWLVELVAGMAWFACVNTWGGPKWSRTKLAEQLWQVVVETPKDAVESIAHFAIHNTPHWFATGAMMTLTTVTTIWLLPMSRAKSKVRTAHVVRASVYALSWIVGVMAHYLFFRVGWYALSVSNELLSANAGRSALLDDTMSFFSGMSNLSGYDWGDWQIVSFARTILIGAWILAYWWYVLRRWWRMDDAPTVFAAVAVPAVLAGLVGVLWTGL